MRDRINPTEKAAYLAPPSPNAPDNIVDPSPVASSTGTDFADVDEVEENNYSEPAKLQQTTKGAAASSHIKSPVQAELKVPILALGRST